jgi:hypothetical protein
MIRSALLAATAAVAVSLTVPAANAAPLGGVGNVAVQPTGGPANVEKATFFRYGYSDGGRRYYGRRYYGGGNWRHRNWRRW